MASIFRVASRALPRSSSMLARARPTSASTQSPMSRHFSRTAARCEIIKKFTEDHEWIAVDTETKIGTIGITEYAQNALGDVVYVELPTIGDEISAGDSIGAVESVKSASDIMSPISGTITETNEELDKKPGLINKSAEGESGWIARIEVTEAGLEELQELMDEEAYKEHTTSSHD